MLGIHWSYLHDKSQSLNSHSLTRHFKLRKEVCSWIPDRTTWSLCKTHVHSHHRNMAFVHAIHRVKIFYYWNRSQIYSWFQWSEDIAVPYNAEYLHQYSPKVFIFSPCGFLLHQYLWKSNFCIKDSKTILTQRFILLCQEILCKKKEMFSPPSTSVKNPQASKAKLIFYKQ